MKVNRMNDYFIKYLLGSEENKSVTLTFLNSIVGGGEEIFEDVFFANKDQEPELEDGKESRLDIKAKTDKGEMIDIEVQVREHKEMARRSLYYWSKMYGSQLGKGEAYSVLNPAITINLLDFVCLEEESIWHNVYRVLNLQSHKELTNHLEMHFLELPKLKVRGPEGLPQSEQWGAYFSSQLSDEEMEAIPMLSEALRAEMEFTADEVRQYHYEMREKAIRDRISFEQEAFENGKAEGRAEGRAEGEVNGARNAKLQDARNMLADGVPIEKVMQYTGLSREEIESIK